eukprot:TRINITY_DN2336_c0_g1_i3.p2 TRINITY_DN2336_c0_g1~~TRINITY_DN2336_c0_g1_i3.p2  ORF type:complete len:123 (-),score=21.76 TRINITY_DN2336_c0_g1_i3:224-592(-)
MARNNYFSHQSQDQRSPWDRAEAQGISANLENIAAGSSTAQATLDQWKRSDGHCRGMLNPNTRLFGIGWGYDAGSTYRHYWTQMMSFSREMPEKACYPISALEAAVSEEEGFRAIGEPAIRP